MLFLVFVVGWLDLKFRNVLMFSLLSVSVADFVGWLNCEFQNPVDFSVSSAIIVIVNAAAAAVGGGRGHAKD